MAAESSSLTAACVAVLVGRVLLVAQQSISAMGGRHAGIFPSSQCCFASPRAQLCSLLSSPLVVHCLLEPGLVIPTLALPLME